MINGEDLLHARELTVESMRSSGPGGQNVNKVETAVRLRWNVAASTVLPPDVRDRLLRLAASRITNEGEFLLEARRFRTQESNRRDALERLDRWIARAWDPPRPRRKTRPKRAAKERRLKAKRIRGEVKAARATRDED